MTFIGPMRVVVSWLLHLLRGQLLEEAGVEVAGVVDEDVDASEAIDCGLDRSLGLGVAVTSSLTASRSSASPTAFVTASGSRAGRDDGIAGREGGLGDVDAHAAPGTGDEPDLLIGHRDLLDATVGLHVWGPSNHSSFPVRKARVIGVLAMPP